MNKDTFSNTMKTITICSGKGGVGKSVFTANLAYALSNLDNSKIVVLDSVLDLPNQQIIFGVEPPVRLSNILSGKISTENALFEAKKNVHLLVDTPFDYVGKFDPVISLSDVIKEVKNCNTYDYLLIDTQSGISEQLLEICLLSDMIILVITDEPTSLLDAYGLIKILLNYINPDKIKILVNNVIDSEDAVEISDKLNLATNKFLDLNLDLLGFVPYSRNVRLSIQRQDILLSHNENDEAAISIMEIAKILKSKYFSHTNISAKSDVEIN